MRYLPNKLDVLQAHMHKVHKLGNAQTDTSYYTYYQNPIKNKSAHSKISNAFWSIPVRNAVRRVFYGLAGERSWLMNWPDPSPARSLSLVVGKVVGGDLVIKESLVSLQYLASLTRKKTD